MNRALCVDVGNELEATNVSAALYIVREQLEKFAKNKVEIIVK
ncbi:hypothetical protein [Candidatus Thioglobus sp.]